MQTCVGLSRPFPSRGSKHLVKNCDSICSSVPLITMNFVRRVASLYIVTVVITTATTTGVVTAAAASTSSTSTTAATICPKSNSIEQGIKYHDDSQCDRVMYNDYKTNRVGRYERIQSFKAIGGISTVPTQKTITCPIQRVNMKEVHQSNVGLDTVFFVENHASTPIVVAYMNEEDNVEVSARNPKITPPIADPTAILQPNEWMAIETFEGHIFVVREVLKEGIAGNVLLQHRVGLIPIGANYNDASCASSQDIEPVIEVQDDDDETITTITAPIFQRTPTQNYRPCHTIDVGFRNVASCPLHGYYVQPGTEQSQCKETFKLHLGVESINTKDFIQDWTSSTKYEGTFIGHTFHFRLASNPTILVDTITIQPVIVTDCPVSSAAGVVAQGSTEDAIPISIRSLGNINSTNDINDLYGMLYPTNNTASSSLNNLLSKTI